MDLTRRDFRAMIMYDYEKRLTAHKCFTSLTEAFGGSAPSKVTVGNCFREFRMGCQSLEDEPGGGRPHTAITDENVAAMCKLTTEDLYITYREIEATLEIGSTDINTILHEYLQVKKLCSMGLKTSKTS